MKQLGLVLVIACIAIGAVFAQERDEPRRTQPITVKGTLQLQDGVIAVNDGSTVYLSPGLGRYAGFIDGLKEGAAVTIEGFVARNFLLPSKLTVAGKTYEFPSPRQGAMSDNSAQRRNEQGPQAGRGADRPERGDHGKDRAFHKGDRRRGHGMDRNAPPGGRNQGGQNRSVCGCCK